MLARRILGSSSSSSSHFSSSTLRSSQLLIARHPVAQHRSPALHTSTSTTSPPPSCPSSPLLAKCWSQSLAAVSSQRTLPHARVYSTDSHDDFKPKIKVSGSEEEAEALIKEDISNNKVFLYMKGDPGFPQCGFSKQVVSILKYLDVDFASRNVLKDSHIRNRIKTFSDWPTIPQLYVNGEFVGGCDIVTNMFKEGELTDLFAANNIDFKVPQSE